jgi:rubredoxin
MAEIHEAHCPECGAPLDAGYIGFFSGIMWHEEEVMGWRRLFPFVLSTARFIISNVGSTPWIRSREARRCPDCGTLVVPT